MELLKVNVDDKIDELLKEYLDKVELLEVLESYVERTKNKIISYMKTKNKKNLVDEFKGKQVVLYEKVVKTKFLNRNYINYELPDEYKEKIYVNTEVKRMSLKIKEIQ